jgi:hypothetical protein
MGARGTAAPPCPAPPTRRAPSEGPQAGSPAYAVLPAPQGCPGDRGPHARRPKRTGSDEVVPWRDNPPWKSRALPCRSVLVFIRG